jgi:hypothetical protein
MVAGAAVIAFLILLLVVPYRILYHSDRPRADLEDGTRCYELGVHEDQVLLYCPDLPPSRVKIVNRALTRPNGNRESIFSLASPPR